MSLTRTFTDLFVAFMLMKVPFPCTPHWLSIRNTLVSDCYAAYVTGISEMRANSIFQLVSMINLRSTVYGSTYCWWYGDLVANCSRSSSHIPNGQSTPVVPWLSHSPLGSEVRGFKPAWVDGFFSERKNPEFLRKGSKAKSWVPCHRFTARKRTSSRN